MNIYIYTHDELCLRLPSGPILGPCCLGSQVQQFRWSQRAARWSQQPWEIQKQSFMWNMEMGDDMQQAMLDQFWSRRLLVGVCVYLDIYKCVYIYNYIYTWRVPPVDGFVWTRSFAPLSTWHSQSVPSCFPVISTRRGRRWLYSHLRTFKCLIIILICIRKI